MQQATHKGHEFSIWYTEVEGKEKDGYKEQLECDPGKDGKWLMEAMKRLIMKDLGNTFEKLRFILVAWLEGL